MRLAALFATTALVLALPAVAQDKIPPTKRNVVIFVADGLRYSSVTPETAPTMYKLRQDGVDFTNSHAVYPTVTTANGSAIATGHFLGDTGNYSNTLYVGFPVKCSVDNAPVITFVEDDCVLRQVKAHYGSGYLGQTTLIQAARQAGYNTVVMGKTGPAAIQYLGALDSSDDDVNAPLGVFIDDSTNRAKKFDGTPMMSTMLGGQLASDVYSATGSGTPPFTAVPNLSQQGYMQGAATQAIMPSLKYADKPFVMLYWSRDPDNTQHAAHDSDGSLVPGINSITSHTAIYSADQALKGILDTLKQWHMEDNTDVFVIADHGFSTISHRLTNAEGELSGPNYAPGFVALDVAKWLGNEKIYDTERGNLLVEPENGERPSGNALIGPTPEHPEAIVAANGGSDFIYVPEGPKARETVKRIYDQLVQQPYVGALFVNDEFLKGGAKDFAGSLPMSAVNLIGAGGLPRPAIVISFRSFVAKGCTLGEQLCAVEIADTSLQTGQGMHGSLSRADTRNFMAAIGPDFKKGFADHAPVANYDVAPTLAHILGITLTGPGTLKGRVAHEALVGGKDVKVEKTTIRSEVAPNGFQTIMNQQEVGGTKYFDAAGKPGHVVGLEEK